MNWAKTLGLAGPIVSFVGTVIVGLYATRGIPKKGDKIRAPKAGWTKLGWVLIGLGFFISIIKEMLY